MTAPGLVRLEDELRTLKSQERPAVIRAIAEARSHGDLSENAEYDAARESSWATWSGVACVSAERTISIWPLMKSWARPVSRVCR